jgi:hypothetical protein
MTWISNPKTRGYRTQSSSLLTFGVTGLLLLVYSQPRQS